MCVGKQLLTFVAIMGVAGAQTPFLYFRAMDVDPTTLAVTLRDGVPGLKQPTGEFFAPIFGGFTTTQSTNWTRG
jgi:hypothetical protein